MTLSLVIIFRIVKGVRAWLSQELIGNCCFPGLCIRAWVPSNTGLDAWSRVFMPRTTRLVCLCKRPLVSRLTYIRSSTCPTRQIPICLKDKLLFLIVFKSQRSLHHQWYLLLMFRFDWHSFSVFYRYCLTLFIWQAFLAVGRRSARISINHSYY